MPKYFDMLKKVKKNDSSQLKPESWFTGFDKLLSYADDFLNRKSRIAQNTRLYELCAVGMQKIEYTKEDYTKTGKHYDRIVDNAALLFEL